MYETFQLESYRNVLHVRVRMAMLKGERGNGRNTDVSRTTIIGSLTLAKRKRRYELKREREREERDRNRQKDVLGVGGKKAKKEEKEERKRKREGGHLCTWLYTPRNVQYAHVINHT